MARTINRLSARSIPSIDKPGMHADGGGLYLRVTKAGSKQWVHVFQWRGKRREMGLGGVNAVSLARAREKAADARALVADRKDPIALNAAKAQVPTFGEVADEFIKSRTVALRSDKSIARLKRILGDKGHVQALRPKMVDAIDTQDVLAALKPLWTDRTETGAMARGYIEAVLNAARAKGHRTGDNPAQWKGHLDHLLSPRQRLSRGHHAAMPYADLPKFMRVLHSQNSNVALGLELLILTALRTGEVVGAKWGEIDLDAKVWSIPAGRMKAGRPHRAPLSERAVEVLRKLGPGEPDAFILPGRKPATHLSNMAFEMLLRRLKLADFTVHGMRSAFRDWAGEETDHPREVAEAALAHVIGDAAEQAYRRGDALEKRRKLMDAWASYCAAVE
jgi:integrase